MYAKITPIWKVLLVMLLGAIGCMGLFVFSVDELCRSNIATRQPLYPGAEIIEAEHNFLRSRALGITRLTLSTSDDEETVREWFREVTLDLLEREQFRGVANVDHFIMTDPESGATLIYLYSECGQT